MDDLQLTVRLEGTEKVVAALRKLAGRDTHTAFAQALTDTAKQTRKRMQDEMRATFDRPTPWIIKSVSYKVDETRLSAQILPTYFGGNPVDPQQVLQAQAFGGPRRAKRAEVVLRQVGLLPAGWVTVPGQGARLDAYGNMQAGQLIQILGQLRATTTAGYARNMAHGKRGIKTQERAGGRFFVIPPGGRTQPGVYQREFMGRGITPVLIFVAGANYRARLDMDKIARDASLQDYLDKRVRFRIYQLAEAV